MQRKADLRSRGCRGVKNVGEAGEVAAKRCSPFAAWFLLRYGLKPGSTRRRSLFASSAQNSG